MPRLEALEDRTVLSTFLVSNLNDSGTGSLRAEIAAANAHPGADEIDFASGLTGTITLTSGELLITDSVTINGPGASQLSVSGNNSSRVFDMTSGLDVTINDLTITHGFALDQAGGILNQGSNLTLSNDVLSQNVVLGSSTTNGARGGGLIHRLAVRNGLQEAASAGDSQVGSPAAPQLLASPTMGLAHAPSEANSVFGFARWGVRARLTGTTRNPRDDPLPSFPLVHRP
jgi:hypothetical protein